MDATERIKSLLEQRGWTAYRLSKSCGLSENTIATILKRNSLPSVGTLEAICKGFGITLSSSRSLIESTGLSEPRRREFSSLVATLLPRKTRGNLLQTKNVSTCYCNLRQFLI